MNKVAFEDKVPNSQFDFTKGYNSLNDNPVLSVEEDAKSSDDDAPKSCFNIEIGGVDGGNQEAHKDLKANILELADCEDELDLARNAILEQLNNHEKEDIPIMIDEPEEGSLSCSRRVTGESEVDPNQVDGSTPFQIIHDFFKTEQQQQPNQSPTKTNARNRNRTVNSDSSPKLKAQQGSEQKKESNSNNTAIIKSIFQNTLKNFGKKQEEKELPKVEGFLKKKSPSFFKVWQVRYVILRDKKFFYYRNEIRDEKPAGCLDFDLFAAKIEIPTSEPKTFIISPIGNNRTFTFKATTEEEALKWVQAIKVHMRASAGSKCLFNSIVAQKHFWGCERMSESKFLTEAQTGDILLFKTDNFVAKMLRKVTRSEFDHVALILKYNERDVLLFEATGQSGVTVCKWSSFKAKNYHLLYSKTIYRKLCLERTAEIIEKIEKFVTNTVGKKYGLSATKFIQNIDSPNANKVADDRTFFCSELIAACYKQINLLPPNISSGQYLPSTFSIDKKLTLLGDAKLGDEILLDFNL